MVSFANKKITPAQATAAAAAAVRPDPSGFAAQFNAAKPAQHGVYIQPGDHVLELNQCKLLSGPTPQGKLRNAFIAEFRVVESTAHRPGTVVSWYCDQNSVGGFGDIKSLIHALANSGSPEAEAISVEDITFDHYQELVNEPEPGKPAPGAGARLHAHAWHKPTKNNGLYTKIQFNPIFANG